MGSLGDRLEKCFMNGDVDLRALMEIASVRFENLSLDDVRFVESECRELRQKFEDAEKVDGYKTNGIFSIGFDSTAYFGLDEIDLIKELANKKIQEGDFRFEVKRLKISKSVLDGHIRDRKAWEEV